MMGVCVSLGVYPFLTAKPVSFKQRINNLYFTPSHDTIQEGVK